MKKTIFILLFVAIICSLTLTFVNAIAEETSVETVETDVELEEVKEDLSVAVAKLNELTGEENFFKNKVLPFIISGSAELILIGLLLIKPFLKNKSLANKLTVAAAQLKAENENLSTILNSTDPDKIKEAFSNLLGDNLTEIKDKIKEEFSGYYKAIAELKTIGETEYSLLKNFVEAARQAWSSKPEVVSLLAKSPVKSTLEELIKYNEKLKNYIREIKGEEAEDTLKNLSV